MPVYAVLLDLLDDNKVLGFSKQDADGLFYINDDGTTLAPVQAAKGRRAATAIGAHVQRRVMHISNAWDSPNDKPQPAQYVTFEEGNNDEPAEGQVSYRQDTVTQPTISNKAIAETVRTWHLRLGHSIPIRAVQRYVKKGALSHVKCLTADCELCVKGKFRRRYDGSLTDAQSVGSLHFNLKERLEVPSIYGPEYFVTIVDENSRLLGVRPIVRKAETSDVILKYVKYFEKQTGCTVRKVHTDGSPEFKRALDELDRQGVEISITTPYTPASNGLVERMHQTVALAARTCLLQANLPAKFWNFAVQHVADCKNFVPGDPSKLSAYERVYRHAPSSLKYLRPLGCRTVYRPNKPKFNTFEERASDGLCLGHIGGGLYHVLTAEHKVIRTKHVKMFEDSFPGLQLFSKATTSSDVPAQEVELDDDFQAPPAQAEVLTEIVDPGALTYVPEVPSTLGNIDDDVRESSNEVEGEQPSDDIIPTDEADRPLDRSTQNPADEREVSTPYSLRPRRRVDYSHAAREQIVPDDDEPMKVDVHG